MGLNGFEWVLLGFIGFEWVLLGFTVCYGAGMALMGFQWILLGFTGFYWVLTGDSLLTPWSTECYRVLPRALLPGFAPRGVPVNNYL